MSNQPKLLKHGNRVRVVTRVDNFFPKGWTGRDGIIARVQVGESRWDPAYIVRRDDGKEDLFWREELERVA